jgi:hypothetical protein
VDTSEKLLSLNEKRATFGVALGDLDIYVCYFSNTDGDFVLLNRTAAALPTLR